MQIDPGPIPTLIISAPELYNLFAASLVAIFPTQIGGIFFIFFNFILLCNSYSDVLKPNINISPKEVVKIQLNALMKNDSPYKDRGILQTWEFAHPNNQRYTGPIERFKTMLKGDSFSMMLNHKENKVVEIFKNDEVATFEVTILGSDKNYFKFKWQVEKNTIDGPTKDCWLTTGVSQPYNLGSSI